MLLIKKGFPEEDELVFCTVQDVQYNCVFVKLDEYDKTGLIHISEVASGRVRNTREYVKEKQKIVCQVLRVNTEKGHIDLSLRRVNESQKRKKLTEIKQEQAAEKIIEVVAKQEKIDVKKFFDHVIGAVSEKYVSLYQCFEDVVAGTVQLGNLGVEKRMAQALTQVILQRVKSPEVHIGGDLFLTSYDPDGVELVKQTLTKAEGKNVVLKYKGAGTYLVYVTGDSYKKAEGVLKKSLDAALVFAKQKKVTALFKRKEA